jgi:hypothetical protein
VVFSPQANYTDRATAACRIKLLIMQIYPVSLFWVWLLIHPPTNTSLNKKQKEHKIKMLDNKSKDSEQLQKLKKKKN